MNEFSQSLAILKTHAKSIIFGCLIGALIAFLILLLQKPVYQAEMIIGPTARTGVPSLSSLLPKTAADAPALQYFVERIDASQSTDFTVFETLLTSPSIHLQVNDNMIDADNKHQWLDKRLKLRPVGLTQFRKVTLKDTNKEKLIPILNTLYRLTDQAIRNDAQSKTQRRISYLNEQLKTTMNPDHRDAIIALLKEQEQTAMMVSIDNHFAADIIEPAYVLNKPIAPNWTILLPLFIALGGFLGLVISGLRQ
jgi:LPS O-antigen subunit length determinant protein (WzzB/FepE family)